VFRPYAGVSTAILFFSKGGETERVWFYDLENDGYSLDDKRNKIEADDLPDTLAQWKTYKKLVETNATEAKINKAFGDKAQKAFVVDAVDIKANKYDLSIKRYKIVPHVDEEYEEPKVILKQLMKLENSIQKELKELEGIL
jgi:type I restriction enzyme M protein